MCRRRRIKRPTRPRRGVLGSRAAGEALLDGNAQWLRRRRSLFMKDAAVS